MENVGVDWIGSAIGAAAGAAAWAGSQLLNLGGSVVDTVVDAVQSLQPDPYEEWLNAPVAESAAPALEFRKPENETNRAPSAEEIVTNAAKAEVVTGVQSPIGPEDPNQYNQLAPVLENKDPQAPLTPDFQPVPEPIPTKTADANVILSWYSSSPYNPDNNSKLALYPRFRGKKGVDTNRAVSQVIYSAVPKTLEDGSLGWTLRVQAHKGKIVQKTWTFDAGDQPPSDGEVGLYGRDDIGNQTFDLFKPSRIGKRTVRRYSLAVPDLPEPIPQYPELIPVNEPLELPTNDSWVPTEVNTPVPGELPGIDGFNPLPLLPLKPPTVVPTQVNNPSTYPAIGTNGQPLPRLETVETTNPTTHILNGRPVNSGGSRASIASIASEVGRIEQKAAQLLERSPGGPGQDINWALLWGVVQLLADLLEQDLPSETYTLSAVCEAEDGQQPATSVILPPEKWAQRLISLGDMLPTLLQAQKDYKQPICGSSNEKPLLEGDWVTTRWLSTEKMDHSGVRLRKLFRYRTKSTRNLGQLSAYWESFTWEAGPVGVFHKGAWWGTPQVWAASQEEGQRVIRFAAAEAGIDPDKDGQWGTCSSRSPRYGMSGTMTIHLKEGFPWVSAREGPNWPNTLARQH